MENRISMKQEIEKCNYGDVSEEIRNKEHMRDKIQDTKDLLNQENFGPTHIHIWCNDDATNSLSIYTSFVVLSLFTPGQIYFICDHVQVRKPTSAFCFYFSDY